MLSVNANSVLNVIILDTFGEKTAKYTLKGVNKGRVSEKTIEKCFYDKNETKE